MSEFSVHVTKDYLVFCSAHFITYGGLCETLHGHNYRASVTLEGECDENSYVFDFVTLKRMFKGLCDQIDHRMLLPAHNPLLVLAEEGNGLAVYYKQKKYVFPKEDVVILPIPNTTAEMLAQYLAHQVDQVLRSRNATNIRVISVEVEETFGQSALCRYPVPPERLVNEMALEEAYAGSAYRQSA